MPPVSPLTPAAGPRAQLREALTSLGEYARSCLAATRGQTRLGWRWIVAAIWSVGIAGDVATTLWMDHVGGFGEANPTAAAGMSRIGLVPYVLAASVVCAVLAALSVGVARRREQRVVQATAILLGVIKLLVACDNLYNYFTA